MNLNAVRKFLQGCSRYLEIKFHGSSKDGRAHTVEDDEHCGLPNGVSGGSRRQTLTHLHRFTAPLAGISLAIRLPCVKVDGDWVKQN